MAAAERTARFAVPADAGTPDAERVSDDVAVVTLRTAGGQIPSREDVENLGAAWVGPVVTDQVGEESYPTGEVSVRFNEEPSDDELERIEAAHGVRAVRRNEFAPSQVVFEAADPHGVFLPDKCEELAQDPAVEHAWMNTTSRFRRA